LPRQHPHGAASGQSEHTRSAGGSDRYARDNANGPAGSQGGDTRNDAGTHGYSDAQGGHSRDDANDHINGADFDRRQA
jgi:hypothetical protein